ncbi:S1/P1 nuclease [Mucilaginibacter sp. HC2]|uniref:S1/P1 nuclease n=1 Tax=Mucilaginibacter inviolabilis TaxID=2714892 RepID=UPI001409EDB1|nr:S1/P1 nuclease [Mucilaginibacter inviolabilis]NHA03318.1 S1/P1 nuclease [Mucilaginibacter inviolabilis]
MRKIIVPGIALAMTLALVSWGFKGHRAIATIAEKHLTANTAKAVNIYLKGVKMPEVSTWADENKDKTTAPWHYLNLPLGLSHEQFTDAVSKQGSDNIYSAILKEEAILKDQASSPEQKNEALKYLIHLVGDAHQPMHVSRKEDKGGNTIQLQFDGQGSNLHSLWDSKLIDHEGLSEAEIAVKYDWANAAQIKKWQADSPMEWLWESYRISTELYADIKPGQRVDDSYYQKYIPTVHLRIEQAGIRLAGELNRLLNDNPVKTAPFQAVSAPANPQANEVKLEEINDYVGKAVKVRGKVYSSKDIGSMTLVNLGAAYPNQLLTVVLKQGAKALTDKVKDQTISVQGTVITFKGKPEIVVTDSTQLQFDK